MNTNTLIRKTKAELINIIDSQSKKIANLSDIIDGIEINKIKDNSLRERLNSLAKKYQEKEIELDRLKKAYDDNFDKQGKELQKTIIKYNAEIRDKDIQYNALTQIRNVISKENDELKLKQTDYENKIKDLSENIHKLEDESNSLFLENQNKAEIIEIMNSSSNADKLEIKILKEDLSNKESLLKVNAIRYIICMIVVTLLGVFVF